MHRSTRMGSLWQRGSTFLLARQKALLAANIIGALVYVLAASSSWAIPQEREAGIQTTTGEPFIWFLSVMPIVAIFLVINVAWGTAVVSRRRWKDGTDWLVGAAVWLVAIVVDFAHH